MSLPSLVECHGVLIEDLDLWLLAVLLQITHHLSHHQDVLLGLLHFLLVYLTTVAKLLEVLQRLDEQI